MNASIVHSGCRLWINKKIVYFCIFSVLFVFVKEVFAGSDEINLIFSGNIMGQLVPCNCPTNPAGGLNRRMSALKNLRLKNTIIVDAGNFSSIDPITGPETTRNLIYGLDSIGVNLIVPGCRDLKYGLNNYKELNNLNNIRFISCNVKSKIDHSEEILCSYTYQFQQDNGNEISITLIGLTQQSEYHQLPENHAYKLADAETALRNEIEKLSPKNNYMILLTDADIGYIENSIPDDLLDQFDIIISSSYRNNRKVYNLSTGQKVYNPGKQGKYFDYIIIDPDSKDGHVQYKYFLLDASFDKIPDIGRGKIEQ